MRFCWHKWSKWGAAYEAYCGTRQSSVCEKCGKLRVCKVSAGGLNGASSIETGRAVNINKVLEVDER